MTRLPPCTGAPPVVPDEDDEPDDPQAARTASALAAARIRTAVVR